MSLDRSSSGRPFKAIVFDWDGTLMDSKQTIVDTYREVTSDVLGREIPATEAEIDELIQLRVQDAVITLADGDEALAERLAERFHAVHIVNQANTSPFPGTLEALAELAALGVPIGVATSKARSRMELDGERTGLSRFVGVAVTGDDVARAKPDPASVAAAIESLGAEPQAALYVGDGPNDVIAGRAAGARVAGVSYGFHPAAMRAERPDYVVDHPGELLAIVRGSAPS